MLKVINVVGARPNFMKVAPLVEAMKRREQEFAPLVVHTGQHYDETMSDAFFRDLKLPEPDAYLGVGSASAAAQVAAVIERFEPVLTSQKPDWVIVVGDVNSTLASALTAAKVGVPVAHVEAGLRSRDRAMPEELNRILTDQISDLLFTPSADANANLLSEGIPESRIRLVGNIMIDSLLVHLPRARQSPLIRDLELRDREYAVLTLHRPANVDEEKQLHDLISTMASVAEHLPIVFPVHPRTRKNLDNLRLPSRNIRAIDPVGYLDFLGILSRSKFVITDSGGIQEEATVLGVPCLTLRQNTERPITVEVGTNTVVGTDPQAILSTVSSILDGSYKTRSSVPPLWDGRTADRILDELLRYR
jgi:UDP-N-acetylglucosamine 2-epimerase (non-hydrolysing)